MLWVQGLGAIAVRCCSLAAVAVNLTALGYFKYTGFLIRNLNEILHVCVGQFPRSYCRWEYLFSLFTQIAFLVDAYRGETKHYSLLEYSLFVTIFPHLIAGRYSTIRT